MRMTRYAFEYSTSSQHAASDTRSKFQAIFQFPWGEDEEVDAAHRALLNLQSGVEDPAETPSLGFEQLKLDLMKAIQPYDLSSIMDGMRLMKAHSYNFAYQLLDTAKYRACLTTCEYWYNNYLYRDDGTYKKLPLDIPLWESVHYWKLSVMRMMILPFTKSSLNFSKAEITLWKMSDKVLEEVYREHISKALVKSQSFQDLIGAERLRMICRFEQKVTGKEEAKEELKDDDWEETADDEAEAEETGFLPVNNELLDIRYEILPMLSLPMLYHRQAARPPLLSTWVEKLISHNTS
ncbi:MAG: hypothetical protein Q9221_006243 [Calogaya cf. arnoldii]